MQSQPLGQHSGDKCGPWSAEVEALSWALFSSSALVVLGCREYGFVSTSLSLDFLMCRIINSFYLSVLYGHHALA